MSARLIKPRTALATILVEVRYTLSRLQADPRAAAFVADFQARRDAWTAIHQEELGYLEAASDAQARVDADDDALDAFASKVSKAVLTITGDDRSHTLYLHFFGGKPLSLFTRPVLGGQLGTMKKWHESLSQSAYPVLVGLAPELLGLLGDADAALAARAEAQQKAKLFREIGARRLFVDRLNGDRKTTHAALTKLAIETPELPRDFADRFFRTDEGRDEEEAPTIASVTAGIAALEGQLAEQKALLTELQQEAEAAAKAHEEQEAIAAELLALTEQAAEIAKKKAEIEKKLGNK
jgi:hypothetical protein